MTVRTFLDLSTGHLTQSTRDLLQGQAIETATAPENCSRWVAATPYGWFVYADEEADEEYFPADLIACFKHARAVGCEYILFDADADDCDGLAWYDEESAP